MVKSPPSPSPETVIGQCKKTANSHSSTFGFLPTHKAKTKKPKELEFSQHTDDRNKKQIVHLTNLSKQYRQNEFIWRVFKK